MLLEWFTVTWNVLEAAVAITAGLAAGSVALIGFGIDSGIEVVAASALLWRFRKAGADATEEEHGAAERRALYIVSATFFLLAAYIGFEAASALASSEEPDTSNVGLILALVSLVVMPTLATPSNAPAARSGAARLRRTPSRRGYARTSPLLCWRGLDSMPLSGGGGRTPLRRWLCSP